MKHLPRKLLKPFREHPEGKATTIVFTTQDGKHWDIKVTRNYRVDHHADDSLDLEQLGQVEKPA